MANLWNLHLFIFCLRRFLFQLIFVFLVLPDLFFRSIWISQAEDVFVDTSPSFQQEFLNGLNHIRRIHSVVDLDLDEELSKSASHWGTLLHKKAKKDGGHMRSWYAHPEDEGECVYTEAHSKSPGDWKGQIRNAVSSWYCEITRFNFTDKCFSAGTAQFSQLVWKETERVGVARVVGLGKVADVAIVARFAPHGNCNYQEEFERNVFEPMSDVDMNECIKGSLNKTDQAGHKKHEPHKSKNADAHHKSEPGPAKSSKQKRPAKVDYKVMRAFPMDE